MNQNCCRVHGHVSLRNIMIGYDQCRHHKEMRVEALKIILMCLLHSLPVYENLMVIIKKMIETIVILFKGPWACINEKYNVWISSLLSQQKLESKHCKLT